MLRQTASLLVIAGLLANQLAAIPHAHADDEPVGYDTAPHFHWAWFAWGETDSHDGHAHCPHDGNHSETPCAATSEPVDSPCAQSLCSCFDRESHDHDSVYVPELNCTRSDAAGTTSTIQAPQLTGLICLVAIADHSQAIALTNRHWRPPDDVLDASDIYLTLRTLRI